MQAFLIGSDSWPKVVLALYRIFKPVFTVPTGGNPMALVY